MPRSINSYMIYLCTQVNLLILQTTSLLVLVAICHLG